MTEAVVVAAGEGRRLDAGRRKQFVDLGGRPVLQWSLTTFAGHDRVDRVVAVVPSDAAGSPSRWIRRRADAVVAGGATRTESVRRGVEATTDDAGVLLVHDGVRPFVDAELVGRVADAAAECAAVPVVRLRDTVKEVDGRGRVVRTPDRSRLRRVQTPQGFPASTLRRILRRARREEWSATDEATLCERAGERVVTVQGARRNRKITVREDLEYARWVVQRDGEGGS